MKEGPEGLAVKGRVSLGSLEGLGSSGEYGFGLVSAPCTHVVCVAYCGWLADGASGS